MTEKPRVASQQSQFTLSPRTRDGRSRLVTICAWCPQLHILTLDRTPQDDLLIIQGGQRLMIHRNGELLEVSEGICPACVNKTRNPQARP